MKRPCRGEEEDNIPAGRWKKGRERVCVCRCAGRGCRGRWKRWGGMKDQGGGEREGGKQREKWSPKIGGECGGGKTSRFCAECGWSGHVTRWRELRGGRGSGREMQDRCQEGGDFVERKLEKRVTSDGGKMRLRTEIRHRDVR